MLSAFAEPRRLITLEPFKQPSPRPAIIDPDPAWFGVSWDQLGEAVQAGAASVRSGGRIGDVLRFMGGLSAAFGTVLPGEQRFAVRTEMECGAPSVIQTILNTPGGGIDTPRTASG